MWDLEDENGRVEKRPERGSEVVREMTNERHAVARVWKILQFDKRR